MFFLVFCFFFLFSSPLCAIWTHASKGRDGGGLGVGGKASSKHVSPKGFVPCLWRSVTNMPLSFVASPSGQQCRFGSRYTSRSAQNINVSCFLVFLSKPTSASGSVLIHVPLFLKGLKAQIWRIVCGRDWRIPTFLGNTDSKLSKLTSLFMHVVKIP